MKKTNLEEPPCVVCGKPSRPLKKQVSQSRTRLCHRTKCNRERRRIQQKLRREIRRNRFQFPFETEKHGNPVKVKVEKEDGTAKLKFFAQKVG